MYTITSSYKLQLTELYHSPVVEDELADILRDRVGGDVLLEE